MIKAGFISCQQAWFVVWDTGLTAAPNITFNGCLNDNPRWKLWP
jgi:hypothetical protein